MSTQSSYNIESYILDAIQKTIATMVEEEAEKAISRIKARIRSETAGICASATSNLSFERNGLDLLIRLRDDREQTS